MRTCIFRLIACILLSGFAGLSAVTALAQEELFNYRQMRSSMPADTGPATVAEYEAVVNVSALARSERDSVEFQLPDGNRFVAVPKEIEYRGKDSFAWYGELKGYDGDGHGMITVHRGYVAGRLLLPGRDVIELKPGPEPGVARLLELDSSLFPEDEVISIPGKELQKSEQSPSFPISAPISTSIGPPGSGSIIDVMVVYTAMARQQAGGTPQIEALIQAAVDATNNAFDNSEVFQRIELVYMQETAYDGDQTGASYSQQLAWVGNDSTVATLRNQHQADLVALISGQTPGVCGVANVVGNPPGPSYEDRAFSVTLRSCAVGNLAFPHELGHNMGAHHDPDYVSFPANTTYPWSFGYFFQLPNGLWRRTIMAYPNSCPGACPIIPHFSNPDVLYEGVPTGIANERDNARTLNLTANILAHYRNGGNQLFSTRFGAVHAVDSLDCTTTDWSSAVGLGPTDAGVQDSTNRRYGGPCGLHVPVSNAAYLVSDHPANEVSYNLRFYAFLDDASGLIKLFDTLDGSNNEVFSVWFEDPDLTLRVATTSGEKTATFSNIVSGWHSIHVNWESDTSANVEFLIANRNTTSGSAQVISGNTSTMTISHARLGSVDGRYGSGSLNFDGFVSTRGNTPDRLLEGDANNDGSINTQDWVTVNNEIAGANFADGQPDCNEDGNINSQDIVCIINIMTGG